MENNNSDLINFEVKNFIIRHFLNMNLVLYVQNFLGPCKHGVAWNVGDAMLGVVTMVPRGVFKHHAEET